MGEPAATNLHDPAAVQDLLDKTAQHLRTSPVREHSIVRLGPRGRLLATGDLHDNPVHLAKIIRLARLDASTDHHVVLHGMIHGGNLINGMDFSHRMLCRVAELALHFPGQVHPVLANHELAQLTGKGVSKGAGDSVALFNAGLQYVFSEAWEDVAAAIGRLIAAMPLAVIGGAQGRSAFCAHSLPAPRMMERFDAGVLQRELNDEDFRGPHGAAYLMVWGRQHAAEQIESLAQRWGVKLFCLGHEHADTGIEMRGPRHLVLNSDHEFASVLPIDLAAVPTAEEAVMHAIALRSIGTEANA